MTHSEFRREAEALLGLLVLTDDSESDIQILQEALELRHDLSIEAAAKVADSIQGDMIVGSSIRDLKTKQRSGLDRAG